MNSTIDAPKCVFPPAEEAAMVLVSRCFGSASRELLAFTRFLVERQGLEWLQDSPPKAVE